MTVVQPAIQVCLQLTSRICPSDLVVTLTTTSPLLSFVLHSYLHCTLLISPRETPQWPKTKPWTPKFSLPKKTPSPHPLPRQELVRPVFVFSLRRLYFSHPSLYTAFLILKALPSTSSGISLDQFHRNPTNPQFTLYVDHRGPYARRGHT
jgi:hypothetical protein